MTPVVLGVDIGGTKIAAGRVDSAGSVDSLRITPTRAAEGFSISSEQVWRAIEGALTPEVRAIGICSPGPLDPERGIVINPPNLPGWRDVPLVELAGAKFGLPVALEKDCNAAGLAEAVYGAGQGYTNVFYAGIGTGIGCGIILDGRIYRGAHAAGGEGGHMSIDYRSPIVCGCGTPGCIEALAPGRAFKGGEDLDELAARLGAWLGGVASLLDPGVMVIGGGVARIGEPLFARLRAAMPDWTVNPHARQIPIVPAALGESAGVIGAAAAMWGAL